MVHHIFIVAKVVVEQAFGVRFVTHVSAIRVDVRIEFRLEALIGAHLIVSNVGRLELGAQRNLVNSRDGQVADSHLRQSRGDRDDVEGNGEEAKGQQNEHTKGVFQSESQGESLVDPFNSSVDDVLSGELLLEIVLEDLEPLPSCPRLIQRGLAHIGTIGLLEPLVTREDERGDKEECEEAEEPPQRHGQTGQHVLLQVVVGEIEHLILKVWQLNRL